MTEREDVFARFEELNERLRANPEMDRWEALEVIDAMRVCVDKKNALKEAEEDRRENDRKRAILEEEITQTLIEFFGDTFSWKDLGVLAKQLVDVYATSGEGYES